MHFKIFHIHKLTRFVKLKVIHYSFVYKGESGRKPTFYVVRLHVYRRTIIFKQIQKIIMYILSSIYHFISFDQVLLVAFMKF